jgi:hypothetical protein
MQNVKETEERESGVPLDSPTLHDSSLPDKAHSSTKPGEGGLAESGASLLQPYGQLAMGRRGGQGSGFRVQELRNAESG